MLKEPYKKSGAGRASGYERPAAPPMKNLLTEVNSLLYQHKKSIAASLPKGFNFDRATRVAIAAISKNPYLLKCTKESLFMSIIEAFSLGLEPSSAKKEGDLVPYWNKKKGSYEAQFQIGYRGMIALFRRSGMGSIVYAKEVREKDMFFVSEGTKREISHEPDYLSDRGAVKAYYAVVQYKDGSADFEVMNVGEVKRIQERSKSAGGESSPWDTDPEEMGKKTVLRRLMKRAPMSVDTVILRDEGEPAGETALLDLPDVPALPMEEEPAEEAPQIEEKQEAPAIVSADPPAGLEI